MNSGYGAMQGDRWLPGYYFSRALVSLSWVALALSFGRAIPFLAYFLVIFYLAWDAVANLLDALRSGQARLTSPQGVNCVASAVFCFAIAIALGIGMDAMLRVFGVWAVVSGILHGYASLQRTTPLAVKWIMTLNGAQSVLAGVYFIMGSNAAISPGVLTLVPYIALGAFSFLVSTLWMVLTGNHRFKPSLLSKRSAITRCD